MKVKKSSACNTSASTPDLAGACGRRADTASNKPGKAIKTAPEPYAIAITPNSATAYIICTGAPTGAGGVTPIRTATNTAGKTISIPGGPDAIAITP
jgi:DNA-binding beta-propeller fold protein YncE